jgi:hypothetical protein
MRTPTAWPRRAALAVAAAALLLGPLATGTARAQQAGATDQARQHFTRGKQLFASGEYRGAIAEFAAADKLAPSPLLEFNIALCHERLGERAEAVRRYRLYLERVPEAANRSSVEAKIASLEADLKAEQESKESKPAPKPGLVPPPVPPESGAAPPAGGLPASIGDPELDRVQKIDIGRLRAERGAAAAPRPAGPPPRSAGPPPSEPPPAERQAPPPARDDGGEKKKSKPIYKQWWFWVVAGVGAIVIVSIATADSDSSDRARILPMDGMARDTAQPGGAVLLRF